MWRYDRIFIINSEYVLKDCIRLLRFILQRTPPMKLVLDVSV